ncbi:MAG: hypothetical protein WC715_06290, partial [Patescibacteria group bacterium]
MLLPENKDKNQKPRKAKAGDLKKLFPLRHFAVDGPYSPAYISILVQRGSLKARRIGRNYFTSKEWFSEYLERHAQEQKREEALKMNGRPKTMEYLPAEAADSKENAKESPANPEENAEKKAEKNEEKAAADTHPAIVPGTAIKLFEVKEPSFIHSPKVKIFANAALAVFLLFGILRFTPAILAGFEKFGKEMAASSNISSSSSGALAGVRLELEKINGSISDLEGLVKDNLQSGLKNSFGSALNLYARALDFLIPDQIKKKFALDYSKIYKIELSTNFEQPDNRKQDQNYRPAKTIDQGQVAGEKIAVAEPGELNSKNSGTASFSPAAASGNSFIPKANQPLPAVIQKTLVETRSKLFVNGDADIKGKLTVAKNARFNGGIVSIEGSDFRKALYNSEGLLTVEDDLIVYGALEADNLKVKNTAEFSGTLNLNDVYANNITARRNLSVVGDSLIQGSETIGGNLMVAGTFQAGHTLFSSLGVSGTLGANSLSAGAGGFISGGEARLNGDVTINGSETEINSRTAMNNVLTVSVTSASAFSVGDGTLVNFKVDTTDDIITISGALNYTGDLTMTGNLYLNGDERITNSSATAFTVGDGTDNNLVIDTLNDILTLGKASTTDQVIMNAKQITINSASTTPAILLNYDGTGSIFQIADNGVNRLIMADGGALSHIASSTDFALNINQAGTNGRLINIQDEGTARFTVADQGVTSISTASSTASALTITQNDTGNILDLYAGAANVLTVLQNGNVGIGTTSPLAKFSVQGTAGQPVINIASSTGASLVYVNGSGNVGIGMTNPGNALDIAGTGAIANFGNNSANTSYIQLSGGRAMLGYNNTTANAVIQGSATKGIEFNVNNNTFGSGAAMTILSDGNVGIGTTTPYARLAVNGRGVFDMDVRADYFTATSTTATSTFPWLSATRSNVGTVIEGIWNGTSISDAYIDNNITINGGTISGTTNTMSLGSDAQGDTYYRDSSGYLARLGLGTAGYVLASSSGLPAWVATSTIGVQGRGNGAAYRIAYWTDENTISSDSNFTFNPITSLFTLTGNASTTQLTATGSTYLATDGGNVGIGTTSPWALLSVNAPAGQPSFAIGSSTATSFIVNASGNVGIGTTNPGSLLTVGSNSTNTFTVNSLGSINGNLLNINNLNSANTSALSVKGTSKFDSGLVGQTAVTIYGRPSQTADLFQVGADASNQGSYLDITSTGNVGIGTTSPWALLSVNAPAGQPSFAIGSSTATSFIVNASGNVGIGVSNPTAQFYVHTLSGPVNSYSSGVGSYPDGTQQVLSNGYQGADKFSGIAFRNTQNSSTVGFAYIGTVSDSVGYAGTMVFGQRTGASSFSERMRINQSGNVGIGTTSPSRLLHLYNTASNGLRLESNGNAIYTGLEFKVSGVADSYTKAAIRMAGDTSTDANKLVFSLGQDINGIDSTASADQMVITTAGYVGIGTTSPASVLSINYAGATVLNDTPQINITSNSRYNGLLFNENGSNIADIQVMGSAFTTASRQNNLELWTRTATGDISFHHNSVTPSVIFDSSGNVGIGTTSPWALLSVNAPAGQPSFVIGSSTATSLIVDKNGNIGIGTAVPVAPLQVGSHATGIRGYARLEDDGTDAPALQLADLRSSGRIFTLYSGSPDAGKFSIYDASSGDHRLVIDSAGNIGIGTTSPSGILDLATTAGSNLYVDTYSTTDANPSILTFRKSSTSSIGTITTTETGEEIGRIDFRGVDSGNNFDLGAQITVNQNGAAGTRVPADMIFETWGATAENTNQLVLSNNGNIGIGTTSPVDKLDVYNGNFYLTDSDINHGLTTLAPSNAYLKLG